MTTSDDEKIIKKLYWVTRLAKRVPIEKFIEMGDKNKIISHSSFHVKKENSSNNTDYSQDVIIGYIFPNIKNDQYVTFGNTLHNLFKFDNFNNKPIKNRLYPVTGGISPYICKLAQYYSGHNIHVHNSDASIDNTQEFYSIYFKKMPEFSLFCDKQFAYFASMNSTIRYGSGLCATQQFIRISFEKYKNLCDKTPYYLFINKSVKVINKFLKIYCIQNKWKKNHREKFKWVIDELEYSPDFGIKAIAIVNSLYIRCQ